jgi:hypothetical protein
MPRPGFLGGLSVAFINNAPIIDSPPPAHHQYPANLVNLTFYLYASTVASNVFPIIPAGTNPIATATVTITNASTSTFTLVNGGNYPLAQGQLILMYVQLYSYTTTNDTVIGYYSAGITIV